VSFSEFFLNIGALQMRFTRFYLLFLALFFASPSFAGLITLDWKEAGDDLILFDSDTNTEWLNHSQTRGLSYSTVLEESNTGGAFEGFRVAQLNEIVQLFGSFGLQIVNPTVDSGYFLNAEDTNRLVNIKNLTGSDFYAYYDYTFYFPGLEGELVKSTLMVPDFNSQGYIGFDSGWFVDQASFGVSTWLVRDAISVPEPSLLSLLFISLVFLLFVRRRKSCE
jgi:hypothetical protein